MSTPISVKEMEEYKRTARTRLQHDEQTLLVRRERAWQSARRAAERLKNEFGVQRVAVFGSLVQHDRFSLWSDVDLAAWGLSSRNWLKASAAVREIDVDINLNLVDTANCTPELLAAIERDGIDL